MSALIRLTANPPNWMYKGNRDNDDSIQPADYRTTEPYSYAGIDRYTDILWTRSSFPMLANTSGSQNGILDSMHQLWEWCWPPTGAHPAKKVSGIIKDANGNAVSGATVKLFNTSTGTLVSTTTSGPAGEYTCEDPNNTTSFAVGYLSGSPDTAGTTVNTLTGS